MISHVKEKMLPICRPEKITCRWLNEITSAINTLCPNVKNQQCDKNSQAEDLWNQYLKTLQMNECSKNIIVKKILDYEIDYNVYR